MCTTVIYIYVYYCVLYTWMCIMQTSLFKYAEHFIFRCVLLKLWFKRWQNFHTWGCCLYLVLS